MLGKYKEDMVTVKDVPADKFIKAYAEHLKKTQLITPMENLLLFKTRSCNELTPNDDDWFYTRAASLARKVYLRPGLGVGTMIHLYGKVKRCGRQRNKHGFASSKLIRYILQELSKANVLMRLNDKRNTST